MSFVKKHIVLCPYLGESTIRVLTVLLELEEGERVVCVFGTCILSVVCDRHLVD